MRRRRQWSSTTRAVVIWRHHRPFNNVTGSAVCISSRNAQRSGRPRRRGDRSDNLDRTSQNRRGRHSASYDPEDTLRGGLRWIGDAPLDRNDYVHVRGLTCWSSTGERAAADKITPDVRSSSWMTARRTQRSSRPSRCSTATPVLIQLSRNFGHHKAMMTGLAPGDLVFLDSDLERTRLS